MRVYSVSCRFLIAISIASLVGGGAARADVSVTSCGTTVPAGETGVLVGDLSCSIAPAIIIQKRAALDLSGYTLTVTGPGAGDAIVCADGKCTIASSAAGGRLVASEVDSVVAHTLSGRGKVLLQNLDVDISPPESALAGVRAVGRVRIDAKSVGVSGASGHGIVGPRVRVTDVTLTDNWVGIAVSGRITGAGLTTTGGGYGVAGGAVYLVDSEAHGAVYNGIQGERVRLVDSEVTGNNLGGVAADVGSLTLPKLINTVCGTSQVLEAPPGTSWGVCQND